MFDIEEELKKLPAKPGVYIMHDEADTILYVGKTCTTECAPIFAKYMAGGRRSRRWCSRSRGLNIL